MWGVTVFFVGLTLKLWAKKKYNRTTRALVLIEKNEENILFIYRSVLPKSVLVKDSGDEYKYTACKLSLKHWINLNKIYVLNKVLLKIFNILICLRQYINKLVVGASGEGINSETYKLKSRRRGERASNWWKTRKKTFTDQ